MVLSISSLFFYPSASINKNYESHGCRSAFNFLPGSRREKFKNKNHKKCMKIVHHCIFIQNFKKLVQLKMGSETQLSVLMGSITANSSKVTLQFRKAGSRYASGSGCALRKRAGSAKNECGPTALI